MQSQVLTRAADALKSIASGVDALIQMADDGDFAAFGPEGLIDVIRAFEVQRNRLSRIDHAIVEAAEFESLWERTTARGTAGALAQILHLSIGEAKARVQSAKWLGPRVSLDGQELPAALPVAAAAQSDGAMTPAQAAVIGRCIDELNTSADLTITEVERAEETLVEHAAAFGPRELQRVAAKIVDVLIPDGTPPRDALVDARRGITIGPQRKDGSATITGVLTPEVRAQLWAVLGPLSAPRPAESGLPDQRTATQRTHDALGAACAILLRSDELPRSGGIPATVIITATIEQIAAAAAQVTGGGTWEAKPPTFTTIDGMRLSLNQMLKIASEADLVPAFMNEAGGIASYGRARRYASPGQVQALIARDGGCSFPDCTAPPQWCEAHHVVPWIAGGATDLENLTLLCGYHHRDFERRVWECRMTDGMPHWIPPSWVDPERRPLRNRRLVEPDLRLPLPDNHQPAAAPRRGVATCASTESGQDSVTAPLPAEPTALRVQGAEPTRTWPPRIERALDLAGRIDGILEQAVASWVESALVELAGATGSKAEISYFGDLGAG